MSSELTETGEEFVLTGQNDGPPLVNFLCNDEYGLLIDDQLGGYSFNKLSQSLSRIDDNQLLSSRPGRVMYLRDHDTGEFWCVSHGQNPESQQRIELHHGLGYSIIESEGHQVEFDAKVFVPPTDPVELWELKIKNQTKFKRRLSLYLVMEWSELFDDCRATGSGLFATSRAQGELAGFVGFDHAVDSFETDKAKFFGRGRDYFSPQALADGRLSRTQGQLRGQGLAVIEKKLSLGGQASFELAAIIGLVVGSKPTEKAKRLLTTYSDAAKRHSALTTLSSNWQTLASRHLVRSPDQSLNERYHYWATYQGHLANRWPNLSSYGDRQLFQALATTELADQISLGLLDAPTLAKERLTQLIERQFKDGGVVNDWTRLPLPGTASSNQATIALLGAATSYLNETGDREWLKAHRPYLDGGSGSGLEHLNRAIGFLSQNLSQQRLLQKDQESILLTVQLVAALEGVTPILEAEGDHHQVRQLIELVESLKTAVNKHWTGHSYPRDLSPQKVGDPRQKFHQLDLITQVWAVISGSADERRTTQALTTIKKQLLTRRGAVDLTPPYPAADPAFLWSLDLPGEGSNGAIDTEHNLLLAKALAKVGDGDTLIKFLSTSGLWSPAIVGLAGSELVRFGAPVALRWQKTVLEDLAGIKPTLNGLKIDPCLPRDWRSLEINRLFRGAEYHFRISNSLRVSRGVERIIVDGNRLTGQVIPPFRAGSHIVEVFLG